ncbi:MAG: DUF2326 domain-containing protein [Niveispirillum sp.]|uniref:DUF2326 domain-containing protein n=1 Tax=Niveispirillum sp. TaxID=1917217 RepID=UPI003BA5B5B5
MLHRLTADRAGFKTLEFRPGLNIILATRADSGEQDSKSASERRSRNGAGKSSIIDLVHFLLGGKPEGALTVPTLAEWNFTLDLDIGPKRLEVMRSVANAKKVLVRSPQFGADVVPNTQWCKRLGEEWFGLREKRGNGDVTYRQLFSYFSRRKRDGGLDSPTRTFRNQPTASSETSLAHLFGLDAELVRRLHQAKAALKETKAAQSALATLDKAEAEGSKRADLEAQLEAQIASVKLGRDRLAERIENFNVLPAFRELERELATLNQDSRDLSDRDVIDQEAIDVNTRALEAEILTDAPDIARLFDEARIVFPDLVTVRFEEVQRFHEKLLENRQSHLQSEIAAAHRRIANRVPLRERIEARRRDITRSLRASGPADELLRLRDELAGRESELKHLQGRLQEARKLEERAEYLDREVEEAVRALRQDRRERSTIVNSASRTFSEISERLYEKPGQLVISATERGLSFQPQTPADGSAGVMSMEVFCFDLTLATLAQNRGEGPGFIIHDSHLFEPVDGRQFARALQIAADFSASTGIQYVALLNSDELARAESEGDANFADYVLETKLSDTPDGGLFGMRFD